MVSTHHSFYPDKEIKFTLFALQLRERDRQTDRQATERDCLDQ